MKQEATKLLDYGAIGLIAFIFLAALIAVVLYLKNQNEKLLKEKNDEIASLRREVNEMRRTMEGRFSDTLDSCADAIMENSKALYENASVVKKTEGVLLVITEIIHDKK